MHNFSHDVVQCTRLQFLFGKKYLRWGGRLNPQPDPSAVAVSRIRRIFYCCLKSAGKIIRLLQIVIRRYDFGGISAWSTSPQLSGDNINCLACFHISVNWHTSTCLLLQHLCLLSPCSQQQDCLLTASDPACQLRCLIRYHLFMTITGSSPNSL